MKVIIADSETTGMWDFKAPFNSIRQPHLVQLAFRLMDPFSGRVYQTFSAFIKPHLYDRIDPGAERIHGISIEDAEKYGVDVRLAMNEFQNSLDNADMLVCHNVEFDSRVFDRTFSATFDQDAKVRDKPSYCTMKETTKLVGAQGPRGLKWPKLIELHEFLFDKGFDGAHDALEDVLATERCLVELCKRGFIEDAGEKLAG